MANIINITINVDDETGQGTASAAKSANVLQGVFQGVGQKLASVAMEIPGKVIGFLGDAIGAASDLNETMSKNQTVFGDASKELLTWADNAPKAMGMTRQAALDATGTLGNMFTQLGVGTEEARKLSQANVQLAADFASFHNASQPEVLEAMSAAYRGEYDAVQKFVPLINAAKVEEEALAMTHKKSKDALTDRDKALAVDSLMMKGAGAAAGDFARTSDGAANQTRIAGAMFEDLKVKIGQGLLPAWTSLLSFITGSFLPVMMTLGNWLASQLGPILETVQGGIQAFAAAFQAGGDDITSSGFAGQLERVGLIARTVFDWLATNVPPALAAVGSAFSSIVAAAAPFWDALNMNQSLLIGVAAAIGTLLVMAVISLTTALWGMAAAVIAATWPFLAIVGAVAAVAAAVMYAYNNWEWFRNGVSAVVQWLASTVPPILEAVRAAVQTAFGWISAVAVPMILNAFNSFMGFLQATFLPAVSAVWNAITVVIGVVASVIMAIVQRISNFISDNWNWISGLASAIWDQITNLISNAWQIISNIIQLALNLITGNWSAAWQNIQNILSAVWNMITGTIGNSVRAIGNTVMLLVSFVGNMVGGVANKLGELLGWFTSLPGKIMGAIAGLAGDMLAAGGRIIQSLIDGIKNKIGGAVDAVKGGLSAIRNLLPFSPAKVGPFSGRGYPLYSGRALAESLATGIHQRMGQVTEATRGMLDATGMSPSLPAVGVPAAAGLGAGGGTTVVNNYIQGSIRSDRDLVRLIRDEFTNLGFGGGAPAPRSGSN